MLGNLLLYLIRGKLLGGTVARRMLLGESSGDLFLMSSYLVTKLRGSKCLVIEVALQVTIRVAPFVEPGQ